MISHIFPLLARPFKEWAPEEFKAHVQSLYYKPQPKKSAPKKKRLRDFKVTVRRLKKGSLSVTTKRDPKYVTREEYQTLAKAHPENELFIALRLAGVHVYESHEEAEKMKAGNGDGFTIG